MRVLFLTNIPSPYRVDFFNELGKLCNLTVLFERKDATNRQEQWLKNKIHTFNALFLKGKKVHSDSAIDLGVIKYLDKKRYDIIVVGGYATPTGMLAINYMKINRIPFILNADGGFINKNENFLKKHIKNHHISSAICWLSTGEETTKYFEYYGANIQNIFEYPFTSLYQKDILEDVVDIDKKKKTRVNLNINEEKVILTVGQFIHRKGFDVLLNACKKIHKDYGVYIVGGEPTEEYIKLKEEFNLTNVHFVGFKSKEELKEYYISSDLFVLPTREDIWGLVINEAMAYGLPVITTNRCIAGLEMVQDYENGFIVPVNNIDLLARRINEILEDEIMARKMSKRNLEKIQRYTIENMAEQHFDIFNKYNHGENYNETNV